MKLYNIIITLFACAAMAACGSSKDDDCGCNTGDNGNNNSNGEEQSEQILLSAIPELELITDPATRADFPNAKRIGVVATYHNGGVHDWLAYNDINNEAATAKTPVSGTYPFAWQNQKYWPLDNSELVFLAYSPHSSDNAGVTLRADRVTLDISLQQNTPDVMYASNNVNPTPYRKNPLQVVDLGMFKHVFSQVTVKVVSDDENPPSPSVLLTSLQLHTTKRNASFNLLEGDSGLHLWTDEAFTYNLYSGSYNFSSTPFTSTVFVYPATEDFTSVSIKLKDGNIATLVEKNFQVTPDFKDENDDPVTFQRAVNTTLTIKISRKSIQTPEDNFNLQGVLTDWVLKDDFGVIIN